MTNEVYMGIETFKKRIMKPLTIYNKKNRLEMN